MGVTRPFDLTDHAHRRYNPLTREWLLVSPHRTKRPWLGQVETPPSEERPRYDPTCYLCPGNERAGGARNPLYTSTFVFDNDFSALGLETMVAATAVGPPTGRVDEGQPFDTAQDRPFDIAQGELLVARAEQGICRVICFSPRHDLTLPEMTLPAIRRVVDVWAEQYQELGSLPQIGHVQIFENKGAMMGASNQHPHGQAWANMSLPHEPAKELAAQTDYWQQNRSCLLCDYLGLEERLHERLICSNDHFVALVPFWAVWPFETLLLSRRHVPSLLELTDGERDSLAAIVQELTTRYDNLFQISFPYSMGLHQQPTQGRDFAGWHLHAHTYPPLLRSATVRKFMVGYELLAEPQRDIPAEAAAARLREVDAVHYRQRVGIGSAGQDA
jgi:UDPglucose--hexose-1-phosphate uridylyltransferase